MYSLYTLKGVLKNIFLRYKRCLNASNWSKPTKSLISEINCEIVHKKIPKVKHLHSTEAEKIKAMVHTQDHNFFEKLITTGM